MFAAVEAAFLAGAGESEPAIAVVAVEVRAADVADAAVAEEGGEVFHGGAGELDVVDVDGGDLGGAGSGRRRRRPGGELGDFAGDGFDFKGKRVDQQITVAFAADIFAEAEEHQVNGEGLGSLADAFENLTVIKIGERGIALEDQADAALAEGGFAAGVALADEGAFALGAFEDAGGDEFKAQARCAVTSETDICSLSSLCWASAGRGRRRRRRRLRAGLL